MTIKDLTKVESSNIEAIGYGISDNEVGYLFVKYLNGSSYTYKGVPKELYYKLLSSESKGRFMNESIKGQFEYKKVDLK